MRIACSAILVAGAALLAGSSGSIAAPVNGGAIKAAADGIGIGESVHCRPFRHWHPWGYSRGCRGGVTIYEREPRFRHRFGIREEFRGGFRTRERAGVTIRGEERIGGEERTRGGTTFRSGTREGATVRGSATIRSGGAGEVSPRGSASGSQTGATTTNTGGGRQMNTAPTGAGGQNRSGAGAGNAQGGSQGGSSQQKQ